MRKFTIWYTAPNVIKVIRSVRLRFFWFFYYRLVCLCVRVRARLAVIRCVKYRHISMNWRHKSLETCVSIKCALTSAAKGLPNWVTVAHKHRIVLISHFSILLIGYRAESVENLHSPFSKQESTPSGGTQNKISYLPMSRIPQVGQPMRQSFQVLRHFPDYCL
jgi:hypothetical protein